MGNASALTTALCKPFDAEIERTKKNLGNNKLRRHEVTFGIRVGALIEALDCSGITGDEAGGITDDKAGNPITGFALAKHNLECKAANVVFKPLDNISKVTVPNGGLAQHQCHLLVDMCDVYGCYKFFAA